MNPKPEPLNLDDYRRPVMNNKSAVITYYVIITLGYAWAIVQLAAGDPFDAWVLFIVTWTFQCYRRAVKKIIAIHTPRTDVNIKEESRILTSNPDLGDYWRIK